MPSTLAWARDGLRPQEWTLTMAGGPPAPSAAGGLADLDDAGLVSACLSGDTGAFDVIVERHRRAVYRLCYRFVPRHEDASDLSQEVFLRAFRALKGFRGQSSLGTWLHRIGVNVCLNRVGVKTPALESIDEHRAIETAGESPADRMLHEERAARMRALVARLPSKQRAALILRVYQDMSHQEIASALGISVGAVKANVFHALKSLKRLIGDETL
jgi:RNA polymerase sigma-70 factor (ECF subfamily)